MENHTDITDDGVLRVVVRMKRELVAKLDAYAFDMATKQPELETNRAFVVRHLLYRALAEVGPGTGG